MTQSVGLQAGVVHDVEVQAGVVQIGGVQASRLYRETIVLVVMELSCDIAYLFRRDLCF